MKERPVLFSGPMVRAILDGRKTQTRRIVGINKDNVWRIGGCRLNPNALAFTQSRQQGLFWYVHEKLGNPTSGLFTEIKCPYGQPGDRLWVRDTWGEFLRGGIAYRATYRDGITSREVFASANRGWRPSIHMPRKFCRLVLNVVGVRIERLQDMNAADAGKEGFGFGCAAYRRFQETWDSLNGIRGPWASNPWVWVIDFGIASIDESKEK